MGSEINLGWKVCNRHKIFHYEFIYCYDTGKRKFSMKWIKFHFIQNGA